MTGSNQNPGDNYPHPPSGGSQGGAGFNGLGHAPGGSDQGDPSTRTNRGGFGSIHGNGERQDLKIP